jgi:hypothetical protein
VLGKLVRNSPRPDVLNRETVVLIVNYLLHPERDVLPLAF